MVSLSTHAHRHVEWREVATFITAAGVLFAVFAGMVQTVTYLNTDHEQSAATARRMDDFSKETRAGFKEVNDQLISMNRTMSDQYAITNSRLGNIEGSVSALRNTKAASMPVVPVASGGVE